MPLHAKEYSSHSRGKWTEYEHLCRLAPDGWKEKKEIETPLAESGMEDMEITVETKKQRSTWARLIKIHLIVIAIEIHLSPSTIGIRRS